MHVVASLVDVFEFSPLLRGHVGHVSFTHECPDTGDAGTAHFQCCVHLPEDTAVPIIHAAMLKEACRQVNFMPEYRIGLKTLVFAHVPEMKAAG